MIPYLKLACDHASSSAKKVTVTHYNNITPDIESIILLYEGDLKDIYLPCTPLCILFLNLSYVCCMFCYR